jgi:hypothetical protein
MPASDHHRRSPAGHAERGDRWRLRADAARAGDHRLAAQGRSTKQIALSLDIPPFTVQDHLKAVFAKVGVESRAELVATLYVRHYEPHRGYTPSPYGWYLDDNVTAL